MCLFQLWFPQGIWLVVGLLAHIIVLFLVFKGISIFSGVAVSIYIPTNSVRGFSFLRNYQSLFCGYFPVAHQRAMMHGLGFFFFFNVWKSLKSLRFALKFFLSIYYGLWWVLTAAWGLSLVVASRGYSALWCMRFPLWWLLLLLSMGLGHAGFSSCSTWAQQFWLVGSRVQAQQLWHMGLSCSMWDLLRSGIKPVSPLHWQANS